jgi:hypothetical protein
MVNQEKLLKEIKSLSDSIRHKNRALKLGISEREKFLESTFKPITEPLKQIGKNIQTPFVTLAGDGILPISKYEQKEDYDEGDTSFTQQGETTATEEESDEGEETDVLTEKEGFSTSEEQEEESINPSNLSKLGSDIKYKGPLARQFVLKMLHSAQANRKYHTFGARMAENGLMIGDSKLDVDERDNIFINNKQYKGTKGLFELIFKPKPHFYTQRDLTVFKNILEDTNAHRKNYSKNSDIHRNSSEKYKTVIAKLFPPKRRNPIKRKLLSTADINLLHKRRKTNQPNLSGKGLLKNLYDTNIIYYNDINKLVDRMKLIYEAKQAGHSGLENEWVALIGELRNRRIIA